MTTYHERDYETGLDYRGARFYDSDVGRFLSLDPLAGEYADLSPYNYVGGNPIKYVDTDGRRIVLPDASQAEALAGDLNRIYQNKHGVGDAFKVVTRDVTVTKANPDYGWGDWLNPWSDTPSTIEVTESRSYIETTDSFDGIEGDKYSKQLKEVIDADSDIRIDFIKDKGKLATRFSKGRKEGFVHDWGGGRTWSSTQVYLSDALKETSTTDKTNNKVHWTIGGVALHEILYHVHPAGSEEGGNPNRMRRYYGQRDNGGEHPIGSHQNIKIQWKPKE